MSNDHVKAKKWPRMECLTCPLCSNVFREATTICVCLHTFCKQCIYQKFEEGVKNCCPVCKAYVGSFPKILLRPDHNLRELVMQMFPFRNSASREERSMSSPVNITTHENSRSNAPGTNGLPQDFGMSQETVRIFHDDKGKAENNDHLNLTPLKSSNYSSTAFKKQTLFQIELPQVAPAISESMVYVHSINKVNKGPSQNRLACNEESEYRTVETYMAEQNSLTKMKKKRKIERKCCKSFIGQKHGDGKIGNSKEISLLSSDGVQWSTGSSKQNEETSCIKENPDISSHSVWFCLLSCKEKRGTTLPQIPKPYIRTNNGDLAVSFVNKYLVQKLNLKHESEVEVMCCGHPLIPTLTLKNLVDIWIQAMTNIGLMYRNCNEGKADGKNFVIELTYRRSKKHRTLH